MNNTLYVLVTKRRPLTLAELVQFVGQPEGYIRSEIEWAKQDIRQCADGRYAAKTAPEYWAIEPKG